MTIRILIMGLPGSGKTTLASALHAYLSTHGSKGLWINADRVREEYDDWDFSVQGRIRQSRRMRDLADKIECDYVIADFVAPLKKMRSVFEPHWIIWLDTIKTSRFDDTNKLFEEPTDYNYRLTTQDAIKWAEGIGQEILGIS